MTDGVQPIDKCFAIPILYGSPWACGGVVGDALLSCEGNEKDDINQTKFEVEASLVAAHLAWINEGLDE